MYPEFYKNLILFTFSMTIYGGFSSTHHPVFLLAGVKIRVIATYYSDGSLRSTYELCSSNVA